MGGHHKQIHEQGEHGALTDGCDCAFRCGDEKNFAGSWHEDRGDAQEQITGRPRHHAAVETEAHIHKKDDYTTATGPSG